MELEALLASAATSFPCSGSTVKATSASPSGPLLVLVIPQVNWLLCPLGLCHHSHRPLLWVWHWHIALRPVC